ncbi:MAG: DUF2809 domain-containing protein [Aureispira sp.]
MNKNNWKRNRIVYLCLIVITIILGLISRSHLIPEIIYPYLGDYLYALMIFWIVGFLLSKTSSLQVVVISIAVCYGIETLQLYQADWITHIRSHRIGGLILGHGFLWSDLASYTLGGITGYVLETIYPKKDTK